MFSRVLVANRGEIALRVIRACHELGAEAVAVYSTADTECQHVRAADRAVKIGPPDPRQSYLSIPSMITAARATGCEAIHPGYGFLAENSSFVRACHDNDVVFIGPSARSMDDLGDKSLAKQLMAAAGLPTIPGSDGSLTDVNHALALADETGYPVMLKATAGGGGRGMRLVESPDQMERHYLAASSEAAAAFGDGALYLEMAVLTPHHIEVQVLGDGRGEVLAFSERDCSIQRRHQKVLEESPSPLLAEDARKQLQEMVRQGCAAVGYQSAGTLEFLVGPDSNFYFMEMNTRVQVEHPVTEMVSGIDIIREQIRLAAGEPLMATGSAPMSGHSMEFRINAEDPQANFSPRGGLVAELGLPGGPGVRVDTHLYQGYTVPTNYDSLLAKLVVWDCDRSACIARGLRALDELKVGGVPTTRELHMDILRHPAFVAGNFSTAFLEEVSDELPSLKGKRTLG